jgi:putative phosphoribosyl transferase
MRVFTDRRDAGQQLAQRLDRYGLHARRPKDPETIVLALPRGGVPVGYEVAARIAAPLDVLVVRKLGVPGHPELAMGAIASGGIRYIDQRLIDALGVPPDALDAVEARERVELERRERAFRVGRPPLDVAGKQVIVIDDGLATGATMAAGIEALRTRNPARVIVAVPVAPPETCEALGRRADQIVCLVTPSRMYSVGTWYEDFEQTTDAEVRELLDAARDHRAQAASPASIGQAASRGQ